MSKERDDQLNRRFGWDLWCLLAGLDECKNDHMVHGWKLAAECNEEWGVRPTCECARYMFPIAGESDDCADQAIESARAIARLSIDEARRMEEMP